ncbi:MAG: type II toxin-antitoxin system Phd/YefM family antitoxin [Deltaproteobacteria bacterium]|nr:type II toxin-antitoxin system Phd/YefM family antitoxin [Deltaproteobacteria bacterium]
MEAKIVPVTALRPRLLQYVGRADKFGQEYIITKNGKPSAVIMGFDEWESWKETVEILSDPKLLRRIKKGRDYFARGGKGKSIAEVFKK